MNDAYSIVNLDGTDVDKFALSREDRIQLSIAISLKRIADAMERANEYGEYGSEAISGSIRRGLMQQG